MDKIERLIQMMDKPDRYSKAEWQEMLDDKDCQEYYRLMCDTAAALNDSSRSDNQQTDKTATEEALLRFQHRYMPAHYRIPLWRKVAAIFIGLLLVSGMTFATVAIVRHHRAAERKEMAVKPTRRACATTTLATARDTTKVKPQTADGIKQFINVPVGNILNEMAAYYELKVDVRSSQAARIRLYFNWNKQYGAPQVVEQLNQFGHIHITLNGKELILESAGGDER